ncbi:MAG TPA: DUF1295 domain-containing protein [SAR86 cluster bacterium]|jgi:protein-S-isoprenylcysteine O-methyltransferase Ste14|nr:DUF1295 domain-containing protein [SAR86 cluster bacterium]
METYTNTLFAWTGISIIAFMALIFKSAPYGRHFIPSLRSSMPSRLGWILMESPTVSLMLLFIIFFIGSLGIVEMTLALIWMVHYIHRGFIWPLRAKLKGKRMSFVVVLLGSIFNLVNVYIQGSWIFIFGSYEKEWLWSPFFITGLSVFLIGLYINIKSDNILINLRKEHGSGYHIPKGFLYNKISNPNYFGEILEWLGWFIMTLSPAGLVFFIWTMANLIPRAKSNHEWCLENIQNYPKDRKKVIPYLY